MQPIETRSFELYFFFVYRAVSMHKYDGNYANNVLMREGTRQRERKRVMWEKNKQWREKRERNREIWWEKWPSCIPHTFLVVIIVVVVAFYASNLIWWAFILYIQYTPHSHNYTCLRTFNAICRTTKIQFLQRANTYSQTTYQTLPLSFWSYFITKSYICDRVKHPFHFPNKLNVSFQ